MVSIAFCKNFRRLFSILLTLAATALHVSAQQDFSFVHNGISRSYTLYVPSAVASTPRPLLLALHGFTQSGQSMMNYSAFNDLADAHDFVVAYPNGVLTSWNVGITGGSTADDVGFLTTLIDTIAAKTPVDTNRVYATGFSNGGFMSYRLACEASSKIAAIAAVAGTMALPTYNNCNPQRPVPVMHVHGTADFVVPYNGNSSFLSVDASLNYWKEYNGCSAEAQTFTYPDLVSEGSTVEAYVWPDGSEGSEVRLLKVVNGGHTWPGNTATSGIGITNMDISASALIWEFVSRFSTDQSVSTAAIFAQSGCEMVPNPASSGSLIKVTANMESGVFQLFDFNGRLLIRQDVRFFDGKTAVQMPELGTGVYVVMLSGNDHIFHSKLIVHQGIR